MNVLRNEKVVEEKKTKGLSLMMVDVEVDAELVECHPGVGGVEGGDVLHGVLLDPLIAGGRSLLAHRLGVGVHYDCCVTQEI